MSTTRNNHFIDEVKTAARNNPKVNMNQVREWQRIAKMLDKVSHLQLPDQEPLKAPRLQSIPLKMFDWQ